MTTHDGTTDKIETIRHTYDSIDLLQSMLQNYTPGQLIMLTKEQKEAANILLEFFKELLSAYPYVFD